MSDVNCPYCGESQEINHDDGYGYDEDCEHEQRCVGCSRKFKFTTSICYYYEALCNGDHKMEQSPLEGHENFYTCSRCDHTELRK